MTDRKRITVKLTPAEIRHLLCYVCDWRDNGYYWGNREHFQERQEKIYNKLRDAIGEKTQNKSD